MDLIADIGATNTRCALVDDDGRIVATEFFRNDDFTGVEHVLGAYLGRLRDMVNPAPNTQVPEDKKTVALNDDTAAPVEDDAESGIDIAAFWQEIQRRYEDVVEQIEQPRRL